MREASSDQPDLVGGEVNRIRNKRLQGGGFQHAEGMSILETNQLKHPGRRRHTWVQLHKESLCTRVSAPVPHERSL